MRAGAAAWTALHHPAPSRQSEPPRDEIRAPLLSQQQSRLLQDLKDPLHFTARGKICEAAVLSAAPHDPKKMGARLRFIHRWSLYFRCRAEEICRGRGRRFKYTRIQTDSIHRHSETCKSPQKPPCGVCCVITEHTNHFLDQRLLVTRRAYSVEIFLYPVWIIPSFTANTNPDRGVSFMGEIHFVV